MRSWTEGALPLALWRSKDKVEISPPFIPPPLRFAGLGVLLIFCSYFFLIFALDSSELACVIPYPEFLSTLVFPLFNAAAITLMTLALISFRRFPSISFPASSTQIVS